MSECKICGRPVEGLRGCFEDTCGECTELCSDADDLCAENCDEMPQDEWEAVTDP
jgi:hypothetical protein